MVKGIGGNGRTGFLNIQQSQDTSGSKDIAEIRKKNKNFVSKLNSSEFLCGFEFRQSDFVEKKQQQNYPSPYFT